MNNKIKKIFARKIAWNVISIRTCEFERNMAE
jgi:hypothetical protein